MQKLCLSTKLRNSTRIKQRPAQYTHAAQAVTFVLRPFRRKRVLLFRFFRDDRLEEGVCCHHLPLLGRELDHTGVVIGELGFHKVMAKRFRRVNQVR